MSCHRFFRLLIHHFSSVLLSLDTVSLIVNCHVTLVHPNNPVPADEHKEIVYSIPCVDCPSVYIGQTGRCLKQRVSEHHRTQRTGTSKHLPWQNTCSSLPCSGSQPIRGDRPTPAHHHTLHNFMDEGNHECFYPMKFSAITVYPIAIATGWLMG